MRKLIIVVLFAVVLCCLWSNLSKKTFVLYYHNVGDYHGGLRSMYIAEKFFGYEMKYLKWRGYKAVKLEEIIDCLINGKALPGKIFAITFDDGYEDVYKNAYPKLESLKYPATEFIATGEIGRTLAHNRTVPEKRLDVSEIRKLSSEWDFESHSVTHRDLDKLPENELKNELQTSMKVIENITGRKPLFICYPSGKYNAGVKYMSREVGYVGGFTTKPGLINKGVKLFELPRVEWKDIKASSFQNIWELKWFFVKILLGA